MYMYILGHAQGWGPNLQTIYKTQTCLGNYVFKNATSPKPREGFLPSR